MTNDDLVGEITQDYPKASFDQQFWKWAPTILKPATVRRTRQRVDDDNGGAYVNVACCVN